MAAVINENDVSRIAGGAKFVGDYSTQRDLRIDGTFEGRLFCDGHLIIGENGIVKGDLIGKNISVNGTVLSGNLYAKEALSLKSGCNVSADLHFQRVQIELDAKFVGQCQLIEASEYDKVAAPLTAMLK